MPSYNHEKYLSEAISSVLNQTYKDFELIIVDDGSKDSSKRIIEDWQKKDNRVRAFFHQKNFGITKTSNHCIAAATGKYVAFIDSDDVWVASKLEKQISILRKNDSVIVWSEGEIINENSVSIGKTFSQKYMASTKKSGYLFEELLSRNFIFLQSVILKREFLNGIKFSSQFRYLNDYQFTVELAQEHPFFFIEEPLVKYRIHGKNTILSDNAKWLNETALIRDYFLQKYGDEVSSKAKSDMFFESSWIRFGIGDKIGAKYFLFKAIQIYPFSCVIRERSIYLVMYFLADLMRKPSDFLLNLFSFANFFLIKFQIKTKLW